MMPNFFHVFDVDNGKLPSPVRNRSITASASDAATGVAEDAFDKAGTTDASDLLSRGVCMGFVLLGSVPAAGAAAEIWEDADTGRAPAPLTTHAGAACAPEWSVR